MIKVALQSVLEDLPRVILFKLISLKAEEVGVNLHPQTINKFVEQILSKRGDELFWDDAGEGGSNSIRLAITKEEVNSAIKTTLEAMPDAVLNASEAISSDIFGTLCKRWPAEHSAQKHDTEEFRSRMEERWGEGLGYLRMLLTCCREVGLETLKRHNKSKARRHMHRRWVLVRLHARACQVADETICLMENGFADGAMARWRTLHELSVVALLIAEGDEDLAERYILHDAVELKRQADDYDTNQVPLGFARIGKRKRASIERRYMDAIDRFGLTFANPYGWAAKHLKHKRPTFKELQVAAGRASMNSYYKMASFNVHAGARSLFFNLSSMGDQDIVLAGRSNAGLVDPGLHTAQTLALITSLYIGETLDLDRLTELNCLLHIRDAVAPALQKAEKQLFRDEQASQKKLDTLASGTGNRKRSGATNGKDEPKKRKRSLP